MIRVFKKPDTLMGDFEKIEIIGNEIRTNEKTFIVENLNNYFFKVYDGLTFDFDATKELYYDILADIGANKLKKISWFDIRKNKKNKNVPNSIKNKIDDIEVFLEDIEDTIDSCSVENDFETINLSA